MTPREWIDRVKLYRAFCILLFLISILLRVCFPDSAPEYISKEFKPRCIFSPSQLVGAAKIPKTGRDMSYAHVNLWSQFPGSLDPKTKEALCCVSENVKGNNILPQKSYSSRAFNLYFFSNSINNGRRSAEIISGIRVRM